MFWHPENISWVIHNNKASQIKSDFSQITRMNFSSLNQPWRPLLPKKTHPCFAYFYCQGSPTHQDWTTKTCQNHWSKTLTARTVPCLCGYCVFMWWAPVLVWSCEKCQLLNNAAFKSFSLLLQKPSWKPTISKHGRHLKDHVRALSNKKAPVQQLTPAVGSWRLLQHVSTAQHSPAVSFHSTQRC